MPLDQSCVAASLVTVLIAFIRMHNIKYGGGSGGGRGTANISENGMRHIDHGLQSCPPT